MEPDRPSAAPRNGITTLLDVHDDPRLYMAAERTFLAWIRTGVALMAFGFVVARFGLLVGDLAIPNNAATGWGTALSLYLGLSLIGAGAAVCVVSAIRHRTYVHAIDTGRFRERFGSKFAFVVVGVLVAAGVAMIVLLLML
jgi:putative membrane protein